MIAIDTMRANVFRAPQEFTVEEVNRPGRDQARP